MSADEQELATFAETNRRVVDYDQIPTVIVDATVSAEDHTYWENPCVDPRAMVRAMLQNFSAGEVVSGASTICQQLVRSVLLPPDLMADPSRQLERKIKEAMLALELDAAYPGQEGKEQIMEFFLNEMFYGNNGYGIWAAVDRYYGKDFLQAQGAPPIRRQPVPSVAPPRRPARQAARSRPAPDPNEVTADEAAMLAGLLRAPSELDPDPIRRPGHRRCRASQCPASSRCPPTPQPVLIRDDVLNDMVQLEYLADAERNEILAEPALVLVPETPQLPGPALRLRHAP